MNFDYYYNEAGLDSGDIKALWKYDSSSGSGAPPYPKTLDFAGNEDYSVFFTYKKLDKNKASLFSNIESGSGFCFGITDNNQFFLEAYDSELKDRYVFKSIPLAKKNTILLKKSGPFFSVSDYDIVSHRISSKDFYTINPSLNLGSGKIKVGRAVNYPDSGFFNDFSGAFDQLALCSELYNIRDDLKVLQGFRPESTITDSYYNTFSYSNDEVNWVDGVEINNFDYAYFKDYYYDLDLFLAQTTGEYLGSISGSNYGGYWIASGYFAKVIDECTASGSARFYSYTGLLPPTGFVSFSDSVSSTFDLVNQYTNHRLNTNFSGYGADVDLNHFLEKVWTSGYNYGTGTSLDSGYYDDYKMNGIYMFDDIKSSILSHIVGAKPSSVGTVTYEDSINGGFIIKPENDTASRVFVDGIEDLSFSISENKINTSFDGTEVIYDSGSLYSPLHFSLSSFSTGDFYKNASVVFSSENSWSQLVRNRLNVNYEEVSDLSLLHNLEVPISNSLGLSYDNYSGNYSTFGEVIYTESFGLLKTEGGLDLEIE